MCKCENVALNYVQNCGECNELRFVPQKTSTMHLMGKLKFDIPKLSGYKKK